MWKPIDTEEAMSAIGEGLHTGLRKVCDSEQARSAWEAISEMPDWDSALSFLVDGLNEMGYWLCEEIEP